MLCSAFHRIRQECLPGCRSILLQKGVVLPNMLKRNCKLNRAMVRAKNFRVNCCILQTVFERLRYAKVVDPPSGILFSCVEPIRPPTVNALGIRIKVPVRIDETAFGQARKLCPFFIGKTGIFTVGLRIFEIDFLVRDVEIPTEI